MNKWIAEFELEDGDTMPEHMDLEYKGVRIDFHCKPQEPTTKNNLGVDKEQLKSMIRGLTKWYVKRDNTEVGEPNTAVGLLYDDVMFGIDRLPSVTPQESIKPVLEDIKAEISRKANSGQWSDATVYGMQKVIAIIDKHISGKETETWQGMHGRNITAPKGTFEKIFNENDTEDDEI